MKRYLLILLIIFTAPLFGQEFAEPDDYQTDQTVYFINDIKFDITGRTLTYAILHNIELKKGDEITGKENLEKFIQQKTQALYNQRVLASSSIDYTILEPLQDGRYPVNLLITARDTNNIIALPYPKFDTNSGFEIYIKARDYNFLGAMIPLRLDLGYRRDINDKNYFSLMLDYAYPLNLFNIDWRISLASFTEYRPEFSIPWYFRNSIGISAGRPIGSVYLSLGVTETAQVNQEMSDGYKFISDVQKGLYLITSPYISVSIPLFDIEGYGSVRYSPSLSSTFHHEFKEWPLTPDRIGPWMSLSHSVGFGRMNWRGNFRDGLAFSIYNSAGFDFRSHKNGGQLLSYYVGATFTYFKAYEEYFNIALRANYRHWIDTASDTAGDILRGIVDKDIASDIMFSVNTNLTVGVMKFRPSEWFNYRRFRFFNLDMHLSPFIDMAVFRHPAFENRYPEASFFFKNLLVSSGLEVYIYPLAFRSFQLRASFGINLSSLHRNYHNRPMGKYELYIGTDFHY